MAFKSGRGAKQKGDAFEVAVAKYLNEKIEGLDAYRAPLSGMRGGRDQATPDLSNTPGIAPELKRTEKVNLHAFMAQAVEAAGDDKPVVITRRNRQSMDDAFVVMRLSDWVELYKAYLAQQEKE